MTYLLGIDIGTSSVKATLVKAEDMLPLANAAQEYPIHKPQAGYAEQNPDDWWRATIHTIRQVIEQANIDTSAIAGIGLSGQMHGFVCLDSAAKPIRPAIIWADARSSAQVEHILAQVSPEDLARHAPGPPAAGFMAATLKWLHEHESETIHKTTTVLLPKDYVRLQMTGELATEPSDAAATWLFDIEHGVWSAQLIAWCGLEDRYLPAIIHSVDVAGPLTAAAAEALNLPAGIPVIAGSADQPAQMLGHGVYQPGTALTIIGTGGQVIHPMPQPHVDRAMRLHVFNHAVPQRWYALGAILSAGLSLRWLRDLLGFAARDDAYAHISQIASDVPPGAEGLIFLPYLSGERTPLMDPLASGTFVGLRLHHEAGHLARAVMEGVTFAMAECLSLVNSLGDTSIHRVIASGGATQSDVWRQIQADVYNTTLHIAAGTDHATVGAALLAGVGCGVYTDVDDACGRLPETTMQIEPDSATTALYAQRRDIFRNIYAHLKDDMHRLIE